MPDDAAEDAPADEDSAPEGDDDAAPLAAGVLLLIDGSLVVDETPALLLSAWLVADDDGEDEAVSPLDATGKLADAPLPARELELPGDSSGQHNPSRQVSPSWHSDGWPHVLRGTHPPSLHSWSSEQSPSLSHEGTHCPPTHALDASHSDDAVQVRRGCPPPSPSPAVPERVHAGSVPRETKNTNA